MKTEDVVDSKVNCLRLQYDIYQVEIGQSVSKYNLILTNMRWCILRSQVEAGHTV